MSEKVAWWEFLWTAWRLKLDQSTPQTTSQTLFDEDIPFIVTAPTPWLLKTTTPAVFSKDYNVNSPFLRVWLYRNYLFQTEDFSNASRVKTNLSWTVTANSATDPYGWTTAEIIPAWNNATGAVSQAITDSSTWAWTFSIFAWTQSWTWTIEIEIDSSAEMWTPKVLNLTTTWKRYYVTQNFVTANTTKTVTVRNWTTPIKLWWAMLDNVGYLRRYSAPQWTTATTADATTAYLPTALSILWNFSSAGITWSTIASTWANTNSQGSVAARDTIEWFITTNITASTAISPVQNSPRNRWSWTAWDSASRTTNRIQQLINWSDTTIMSRLRIAYDKASAWYDEFLNVMSNGVTTALWPTLWTENLTNWALTSWTWRTRTWDMALTWNTLVYTHSTWAWTLTQIEAWLAVALKPNRRYKYVFTTSAVSWIAPTIWIDTVCSIAKVHINTAANATYTIYFKTPATVSDFKLSWTSWATGAVTLDTLSLKEVTDWDFAASGMFTWPKAGTGMKVNEDSIDFIIL